MKLKCIRVNLATHASYNEDTGKFDLSKCTPSEVEQEVVIRHGANGLTISVEPGVTGHEEFYLSDILKHGTFDRAFYWCAGTPCRWDSLRTEPDEMNLLMQQRLLAVL